MKTVIKACMFLAVSMLSGVVLAEDEKSSDTATEVAQAVVDHLKDMTPSVPAVVRPYVEKAVNEAQKAVTESKESSKK